MTLQLLVVFVLLVVASAEQWDGDQLLEKLQQDLKGLGLETIVDDAPQAAAHWHALHAELNQALQTERLDHPPLDPKFPLFKEEPEGVKVSDWIGIVKSVVTKDTTRALISLLQQEVDVGEELSSGELSTAQAMMDRCVAVSDDFLKLFLASHVFQTLLSLATFHVEALGDVHSAAEFIVDKLKEGGDEIAREVAMEVAESVTEEIESGLPSDKHARMEALKKFSNVANATVGAIGDATYGVLTLGIGPLAGRVAQTAVKGVQQLMPRDRQVAACFLAAFAAMSESLLHEGSDPVTAQCIEYRVQSRDDLIHDAGGYSKKARYALFLNDIPEEERVAGTPTVSAVDIYEVLHNDFEFVSKATNVADILRGPISGTSTMLRQYFMGNEFEQAVKFAGVSLVMFLKENFWKRIIEQTKAGLIPLSQVGIVKNLVVKGITVHDYDAGQEYVKAFDCGVRGCWHYCGRDRSKGAWCLTRNPWYHPKAEATINCKRKQDCITATEGKWSSLLQWECAGDCTDIGFF